MRNYSIHPLREGRLPWLFAALLVTFTTLAGYRNAEASTGNNFTMLDPTGAIVGGTNDVTFTWDGTLNTTFQDNGAGTNATLASSAPFFGQQWQAYNVSIYGPGTYTISTADIAGSADCPFGLNCVSGGDYTVTVGPNQIMAHIKFAWGATEGIDVVNVWEAGQAFAPSVMFTDPPRTAAPWSGNADTFWAFMSSDWDGNAINGGGMIDGPFSGFNANFNVVAVSAGDIPPPPDRSIGAVTIEDPSFGGGAAAGWWTLAGLLGLLGMRRRAMGR